MGFDMCIIKIKKKTVEKTLSKYFQKDLSDLPYDVFEKMLNHYDTKHFISRVNILRDIEGKLPYANETYTYLTKEQYELMVEHCKERRRYLEQYQSIDFSGKKMEYGECERLYNWLQSLNIDWDNDVIIYEHDC